MKELNLTAVQVGQLCMISSSMIGHYMHGRRSPSTAVLLRLEKALELPPGWFMYGFSNNGVKAPLKDASIQQLPLVPRLAVYEYIKYAKLPDIGEYRSIIMDFALPEGSLFMRITDDAMSSDNKNPLSLSTGDMVAIARGFEPEVGCLVLVGFSNGEVKIREYQKDGSDITLRAFDSRYPLIYLDNSMEILGVLVEIRKNIFPIQNKNL